MRPVDLSHHERGIERSGVTYDELRAAGIRELERHATGEWTDFNAHDPGITILEQVCWALTDLGYRLDHSIADILAEGGSDGTRGIVPAHAAFDSAPVTLEDLRRVVLDVDGVANVWIEPDEHPAPALHYHHERRTLGTQALPPDTEPLALRGLWRVLIDATSMAPSTIVSDVAMRLFAHRPLCQDYSSIEVLPVQRVVVDADIEIGSVADPEVLCVELLQRLSAHISPRTAFRSLQHRQVDDVALEDLFDGPTLEHGFVDEAGFVAPTRRRDVRSSDLIGVATQVRGVRAVRQLRLATGRTGEEPSNWQPWLLELDPNKAPRLEAHPQRIRLYRNQVPVRVDPRTVLERLQASLGEGDGRRHRPEELRPSLPTGHDREIGRYRSILHQFPKVYGLGPGELPTQTSPHRVGETRQLKAYLQLFDQLLANSFAQAANVANLLSAGDVATQPYAASPVDGEGVDLDEVRRDPERYAEDIAGRANALASSAHGVSLRRRQLDHLLARVGETFVDRIPDAADAVEAWDGLAERRALLEAIPEVAAERGSALNSLLPLAESWSGGLERRVALKLGLRPGAGETFTLVEHLLMRAIADPDGGAGDEDQSEPLLREVATADPYSLQVSFVFPGDHDRFAEHDLADGTHAALGFRRFAEHLIREETPAHLTVYVHWLPEADYARFRRHYEHWHEHRRQWLSSRFAVRQSEGER